MLKTILATLAVCLVAGFAQAEQKPGDCAIPALEATNGKVTVNEDGRATEIDVSRPKSAKTAAAARTTCRTDRHYTVCSNGRYGCIWSERSGRLLGCGAGI